MRRRAHRRRVPSIAALLLVVGVAGACGDDSSDDGSNAQQARTVSGGEPLGPADEGIEGVEAFEVTSVDHTDHRLAYEPRPPVGGEHSPTPATCGFYESDPPLDQHLVHSIEHGAIWVAYAPDLAAADEDVLRELAESQPKVVVTPYEGLDSPLVVTAWARQLALDSADDPRLARFVEQYQAGGQAPEPAAPCVGTGEPAVSAAG